MKSVRPIAWWMILLTFTISAAFSFLAVNTAFAHDNTYMYYGATATFRSSNAGSYAATIQSAASAFDATDLTVSYSSAQGGGYTNINFYQVNRGANYYSGNAVGYNNSSQACAANTPPYNNTGNCNRTDKKARYGDIYLNTYYSNGTDSLSQNLVRHEPGHIFGMAHGPCNEVSVMDLASCSTLYTALQRHDTDYINAYYP